MRKKKENGKPKKGLSLRAQFLCWFLAVVLLVGLSSLAFVTFFLQDYSSASLSRQLDEDSEMLAKYVGQMSPTSVDIANAVADKIVQKNNAVFILSKDGKLLQNRNTASMEAQTDGDFNDTIESLLKPLLDHDGGERIVMNGQLYVISTSTVRSMTGTVLGYVAVAAQNDDSFVLKRTTRFYMISILVSTVIAGIASFFASKIMTRRIHILQNRARLLAQRKFDIVVPQTVYGYDEIGSLGQSFEEMAHDIQAYDANQKIFLQNAAHELRTPLMSIRGYVEGLRDGVFTDTEETYGSVLSQVDRLEKLVNEVLYLSKIETSENENNRAVVSVGDITEEVRMRLQGVQVGSEVQIDFGDVPDVKINADGDQVSTALCNILTNDLRYAKSVIRLVWTVQNGMLTVKIADDGRGFNEADLPHLFERFYKGSKGKFGLGLAIAKAIFEAHNGGIKAYNAPEGGAVFEITLPVCGN